MYKSSARRTDGLFSRTAFNTVVDSRTAAPGTITTAEVPVPSRVIPLAKSFDAWFAKACERHVERRFASARDQAEALGRCVVGGWERRSMSGRPGSIPPARPGSIPPVANARGSVPVVFRARHSRARSRGRRAARAGVPEARWIRHDVDRLGSTMGRPERMAAPGVVDNRGRAPLRSRRPRRCRPRPVADAEPPHLSVDRQNDGEVRRSRRAPAGRRRRVFDAGWVRVDQRGGAGARQNA